MRKKGGPGLKAAFLRGKGLILGEETLGKAILNDFFRKKSASKRIEARGEDSLIA